ncbi:MAG: hypothetical protein AB1422_14400 [bacterium]
MNQEKENLIESLSKMLGLIGGGWIILELIKTFSKKVYRCPRCHGRIEERGISQCPSCGVKLRWKI